MTAVPVPLSFPQRLLAFMEAYRPGSVTDPGWTITTAFEAAGQLDSATLAEAWTQTIARHDALDLVPVLALGRDGGHHAGTGGRAEVLEVVASGDVRDELHDLLRRPVPLDASPHARLCHVVDRGAGRSFVGIALHHACGDERSMTVLWRDLAVAYEAVSRRDAVVRPPAAGYAAFAGAQNADPALVDRRVEYWQQTLAGMATAPVRAVRDRSGAQGADRCCTSSSHPRSWTASSRWRERRRPRPSWCCSPPTP